MYVRNEEGFFRSLHKIINTWYNIMLICIFMHKIEKTNLSIRMDLFLRQSRATLCYF